MQNLLLNSQHILHIIQIKSAAILIQGFPKLVIQKSVVITFEPEVNWLGTFHKLRLVLTFSLKLPDAIPLVQSCLEILPVIMESYTGWTLWNDSVAATIS